MSSPFADFFSAGAPEYAQFRPRYPGELFAWLASLCEHRALAWDCATGSGQAAGGLAAHFARVVATDASEAQVTAASPHPRVEYRCASAEASGLEEGSVDLVTVAQALHWLPREAFYQEVRRVLVARGVLAVWGYSLPTVTPTVDPLVRRLHGEIVGPYWPPGRDLVDTAYRSVTFPFPEVDAPAFAIEQRMSRDGFVGYLRTWSAVRRYEQARGSDPLAPLLPPLEADWPPDATRAVRWPLFVRAGRKP